MFYGIISLLLDIKLFTTFYRHKLHHDHYPWESNRYLSSYYMVSTNCYDQKAMPQSHKADKWSSWGS